MGKDADFIYDNIDKYTQYAEKDNRSDLVDVWKTIKQYGEKTCSYAKGRQGKRIS
ncbi:MAG TPA: hypothetical protein VER14_08945 [Phototrophicaceae bacterium]|nr:hypothetical protein [Phototrophicaceae bacterium]